MEIVLEEHVVDSFAIALDVGLAWSRRAPAHMPLTLSVVVDGGRRDNYEFRRGVRLIVR
jgi:hypothetical protein